jgi:DNA invertase Pin-like site-specific DNA recombinase
MSDKITPVHLSLSAFVYIRQSTQLQVQHNLESKRRQYALADRAKALGWNEVETIDDDLGCSGSGSVVRKGFERLVAAVSLGKVGAVLSLEASRLARNNRDWHQLVDLCALAGTLLIDADGIYDPRLLNDRLLLGLKGTMSEFELGLFRQRSWEALKDKARRGELYSKLAVGFVRTARERCEKDPDLRIQQAVGSVFSKFDELGSARQVLFWFRRENLSLPSACYGSEASRVEWKLPTYSTINKFLKNPVYAGVYAYGRRTTRIHVVDGHGRKQTGMPQRPEDWMVLIRDHHEGYISWERYEQNQARLRENENMRGLMHAKGAAREGRSLLAGLLRCGCCGKKFTVRYSGRARSAGYECRVTGNHEGPQCTYLGARNIDAAIEEKVLEAVQPAAVEASIQAEQKSRAEQEERRQSKGLALEQARYEAQRIWRQYEAVEPENRLVATELERRWNSALGKATILEKEMVLLPVRDEMLDAMERERLMALSNDLRSVWNDERSDMRLKKRIVRTLIEEIIVDTRKHALHTEATIHWAGGQHSVVQVARNSVGGHRYVTDKETVELVRELAEVMPDQKTAQTLNRLGLKTSHGHTWKECRVAALRRSYGIAGHDPEERRRKGLLSMQEAAQRLGISAMSVMRLIRGGVLPARQVVACAPRLIVEQDIDKAAVQIAVKGIKTKRRIPLTENPRQQSLIFQ